jgi:hypothetical protein
MKIRTSRDAPTGYKLFNFILTSLQPRRWAHMKRSATNEEMNKSKKRVLIAVTAIVFGMACFAAYHFHKASEGCKCTLRLRAYNQLIQSCGIAADEKVAYNWKNPKDTEAMVLRIFKQHIPACPAGGVVSLVDGIDVDGGPMPIAVCSLAIPRSSLRAPGWHYDPGDGTHGAPPNKSWRANRP